MRTLLSLLLLLVSAVAFAENPQVTTKSGVVEGLDESGIKVFKGVPFAAPPVGDFRWKAPQPVKAWKGVRPAHDFGPSPMQLPIFGDMNFGKAGMSEDCLYLNIWTPTKTFDEKLPVFIYFNGGGLAAGSGCEPRYAGKMYARNGIVAITANYREGIFGFFTHPELTAETDYHGSGNYGFMDQAAAIKWVKENIAAFGGDPERITIMGESAGSMSVSALMASPLSKNLIAQAMGSSGSVLGKDKWATLEQAEQAGVKQMNEMGYKSVKEMRGVSAEVLMKAAGFKGVPIYNIDNHFMPKQPLEIYAAGEQAQVPCLIGNNSAEMGVGMFTFGQAPTMENIKPALGFWLRMDPSVILEKYNIKEDADLMKLPGYELAGDMFIVYSTWKWMDMQSRGKEPVYRYRYCHPRPELIKKDLEAGLAGGVKKKEEGAAVMPPTPGAVHSADIEYQMGNLSTNTEFAWTADDYEVSEIFKSYFVNFIKTGNPNGTGLPQWDAINGQEVPPVMLIDTDTHQERNGEMQARYRMIDDNFFK